MYLPNEILLLILSNIREYALITRMVNRQWHRVSKHVIGCDEYSAIDIYDKWITEGHGHLLKSFFYTRTADVACSIVRNNKPELLEWFFSLGLSSPNWHRLFQYSGQYGDDIRCFLVLLKYYGWRSSKIVDISLHHCNAKILRYWTDEQPDNLYHELYKVALLNRDLDTLEELYSNNIGKLVPVLYLYAGKSGDINMIDWLTNTGLRNTGAYTLRGVLEFGDLELIKTMYSKSPLLTNSSLCGVAAYHGNLEVLSWMESNISMETWVPHIVLEQAIMGNQLDVVKWIHSPDRKYLILIDPPMMSLACSYCGIETLQYLYGIGYMLEDLCIRHAIDRGDPKVLSWILERHPGSYDENMKYATASAIDEDRHLIIEVLLGHFGECIFVDSMISTVRIAKLLIEQHFLDDDQISRCRIATINNGKHSMVRWLDRHC